MAIRTLKIIFLDALTNAELNVLSAELLVLYTLNVLSSAECLPSEATWYTEGTTEKSEYFNRLLCYVLAKGGSREKQSRFSSFVDVCHTPNTPNIDR